MSERAAARRPALSVVVASRGTRQLLEACLDALREQVAASGAELVVARAGDAEWLTSPEGSTRVVRCPAGATMAELRAAGMRAVSGDIVALVEDDRVPAGDWLAQLASRYGQEARG